MAKFPNYKQTEEKDCGPTCLKIISKHYGKTISTKELRDLSETTRLGSSLLGISEAAEKIGYRTLGVKLELDKLTRVNLPCILHWNDKHYVVLYKVKKEKYYVSDPSLGLILYNKEEFIKRWGSFDQKKQSVYGVALLLEVTPHFNSARFKKEKKIGLSFVLKYVLHYKSFLIQLAFGMLAGSLLQLLFPFLTQSIIDVGVKNQDISFIYLVLFAQLFLFIGKSTVEAVRSWILLHLSTRINISLVSDFFIKLMKLPISYFDVRMTGDLLQRINDHSRIERILTTSSLTVLFSLFNLIVFSIVLAYYNTSIFGVFLLGSVTYITWVTIFLKRRKILDYKRFEDISQEQSKVIELISGMQEIKLHNAEQKMRWNWEHIQVKLFNISIKNLTLEQTQSIGSNFINEVKNIFITVLSAKLVIDGSITLGMLVSISYIVGQLNGPLSQLINFVRELQDAHISLERLGEIHRLPDEEFIYGKSCQTFNCDQGINIQITDILYKYPGSSKPVIKNLSLEIPKNKITAIVGVSGSGKTTLMKLLLGFYKVQEGKIIVNNNNLDSVSKKMWRDQCGVVMQEGYIFNDTIAGNICLGCDEIDQDRLKKAADIANINLFVDSLPKGYDTKIGEEGIGLSTGQKQRLLIARAIYKNPKILFFDEATSSLDANNEKIIMQKLNTFFESRTVIIIAHRLSTVKNAHQIVVIDQGEVVECGTHQELTNNKQTYYHLVKNQLELGQ
tara:strand:- start:1718 stop:3910 length:2193 start_codon:yes stop_codon:yes gene_type:complete